VDEKRDNHCKWMMINLKNAQCRKPTISFYIQMAKYYILITFQQWYYIMAVVKIIDIVRG